MGFNMIKPLATPLFAMLVKHKTVSKLTASSDISPENVYYNCQVCPALMLTPTGSIPKTVCPPTPLEWGT